MSEAADLNWSELLALAPTAESSPAPENFFQKRLPQKGHPPFWGRNRFWTGFCQRGHEQFSESKSPPLPGGSHLPHAHPSSFEMRRRGSHIGRGDKTKWGCFLHALDGMRGRAQVVTSRTITANARTTANLKANANIGRRRVTAVLELTEKPGALRRKTGRSCQKGSRCGLVPRCYGFWGANVYAKTLPKLPLESAMNSMPVHR
jgi:hypothetical protein